MLEGLGLKMCLQLQVLLGQGHCCSCQMKPEQPGLAHGKGVLPLGLSRMNKPLYLGPKTDAVLTNLRRRPGHLDSSRDSWSTEELRFGGRRWTTEVAGAGGLGMIEMVELSGTPMANSLWKKSVVCLMSMDVFFKYVRSNLDAGHPDPSSMMILELAANFKLFRWVEL